MLKKTTGHHALYMTLMMLAFPATILAGGLDKDVQPDRHGQKHSFPAPADNTANEQPITRKSGPKDRQMRPSFAPPPPIDPLQKRTRETEPPQNEREQPLVETEPAPLQKRAPPEGYSKNVKRMIRTNNKLGLSRGHIKLYAKQKSWGPSVRIQACFGDNVLTKFMVADRGESQGLQFQFQNVPHKKSRVKRSKWKTVAPRSIIRGRYIFLRAQTDGGEGVITLRVVGNCIDDDPRL